MAIVLTLIGFFVGLALAEGSTSLFGALGGAAIGYFMARFALLERRFRELEIKHKWLRQRLTPERPVATTDSVEPPVTATGEWSEPEPESTEVSGKPMPVPGWEPEPQDVDQCPPLAAGPAPSRERTQPLLGKVLERAGNWLTTGNVPVKVGVILSFIGVAFFLKYAIDKELFRMPIEVRLMAVAAAGVAMIVIGWRLRERLRVYALSLQGGGAGILFLTIYAAFRIWGLLPTGLTFVLLVALAAFTGVLAVIQNARWLIIFGAVGGFLAPVLASTGTGSHVTLFSYYLVLNVTILAVAWYHSWRVVNLVGFAFTFVIGSLWGYRYYTPELFASTQPFLVLHFLLYQAIAVLYAIRQPPEKVGVVDGTLVFGTPLIAFALQAAMVSDFEYGLAISAAVLAAFYGALAAWLFNRQGDYLKVLGESYVALAVAFATLAIPLAFDARWTSAAWALEGAALIWIATRQPQHPANFAGAALIVLAGFAFLLDGWEHESTMPLVNGNVLSGLLISFSALFGARRLQHFDLAPVGKTYEGIAWALFGWGVLWWLATGSEEIEDRFSGKQTVHAWLLFVTLTTSAAAWLGKVRDWSMARAFTWLHLPALGWLAFIYIVAFDHYLTGIGYLAWPLAFVVQALLLHSLDRRQQANAGIWHIFSAALVTMMLMFETAWQVGHVTSGDWSEASASVVPGLLALLVWKIHRLDAWPASAHAAAYGGFTLALVAWQALYLAGISIAEPGDPAPLRYIPLINPFDLALVFAGFMAVASLSFLRRERALFEHEPLAAWLRAYPAYQAVALLVLTTAAVLRGVHHLAGVAWDFDVLFDSVTAQTALSVYWSLLGFAGMILGARGAQRRLWIAGAGFMALVVVKLFLVDLGNSGTVERIISFIAVGALLLVVGYFAPVPPRKAGAP